MAARSIERRRHPPDRGVRLVDGLRRSRRIDHVRFADQWIRTWETILLGLLWLVALWVTRKPVARWIRTARRHGDPRSGTGHARGRRARRGRRRRVRAPARRRPSRPRPGAATDDELGGVVLPPRRRTEAVEGHVVPGQSRRGRGGRPGHVDLGREAAEAAGRHGATASHGVRAGSGQGTGGLRVRRVLRRMGRGVMGGAGRGGEIGVGAEPCAPATSPTWFAPDGTTEQGEDAYLVVMNPFAVDAVFDVVLLTPKRAPIRSSELTDHVLRPGKSVAFRLNAFDEVSRRWGRGRRLVGSRRRLVPGDHAGRRHPQRDRSRPDRFAGIPATRRWGGSVDGRRDGAG